jgi:Zn-finger nucleic acid-binding protein
VPFTNIDSISMRIADLEPTNPPAVKLDAEQKVATLKCPECGGELVGVKNNDLGGVSARTCLVCFGRWVDGSDLARSSHRGFFARFLDYFRKRNTSAPDLTVLEEKEPEITPEESARVAAPDEDPTPE